MSKLTNHTEKIQVAEYGLHYHANDSLFPDIADRVLIQYFIDKVRAQLMKSLDNTTVFMSRRNISKQLGINRSNKLKSSIANLERLGMIKAFKNSFLIYCDEYVAIIQYYESLNKSEKSQFAKEFNEVGIGVAQKRAIQINNRLRIELLSLSGSSINVHGQEWLKSDPNSTSSFNNGSILSQITNQMSKLAQNCATLSSYIDMDELIDGLELSHLQYKWFNFALQTGKVPQDIENDPQKVAQFCATTGSVLSHLVSEIGSVLSHSNNIYNKKKNKRDNPLKNEVQTEEENENFQENIQKGFEGFGKVEILDLDKPSEKIEEDFMEIEDISQQTLKRAERSMRSRNSYRNKPFIKVERIKEIVDCLDEVVKSPVDFFLYQFWWGIFDLYCDHYHPSTKIDEEGEVVDESQLSDWKEMIGAALPQDEIYSLAQNVYEDMLGAIEQGKYVYGDDNEWEVRFGFTTFQDFNPYEIFQWSPCTMQDKSVPALKVAIDRFYDIEANDVFTSSKGGKTDKKVKNSQNKKLIGLILSADNSSLTPIESAIKSFYRDFVVPGEENIINEFTDGKGTTLESGGGLPDHLLKPWCYSLPSVGYNEFTGVLNGKYKPCDGVHKKAYIFSAENVVEWNERNGYINTIAHEALQ
nr:MAG: hypothetical protein [Bacteriophage sp.]